MVMTLLSYDISPHISRRSSSRASRVNLLSMENGNECGESRAGFNDIDG